MPASGGLNINEGDIIKLISEFLQNRTLNISMLSIERETGVINGLFSDDLLFLRQLILDGQWDDVIDFIQPLITIDGFNSQMFQYIILKHKYLELLCIKSEPNVMQDYEATVDEVVKCLNSLEGICPSKEEYSNLCFLLSLPKLSDHSEYQNWNPSNARVECFKQVQPLLQSYLPIEKKDEQKNQMSCNDRLLQLVLKGILYESCVDYCQQQATGSNGDFHYTSILNDTGFSDADLSLLAWLQCIPFEVFSCPFEQRSIKVDIKPLVKPSLEASWSEQILVTPIKPKMFPHSAVPSGRPRSAELMTRSLNPQFDGLSRGLNQGVGRLDWSTPPPTNPLSQSIAHLPHSAANRDPMLMSMDKLFSEGEVIDTRASISDDLKSSPRLSISSNKPASPATPRKSPARSQSPTRSATIGPASSDIGPPKSSLAASVKDSSNELYKEYQRQKQRVQEQLEIQDKQREMYQKELMELERKTEESLGDNRLHEELLLSQSDAPTSVITSTTMAKQDSTMPPVKFRSKIIKNQRSRSTQLKMARLARYNVQPVEISTDIPHSSPSSCSPHSTMCDDIPQTSSAPHPVSASKRKLKYYEVNCVAGTGDSDSHYALMDMECLKEFLQPFLFCKFCDQASLVFSYENKPHMGMAISIKMICSICDEMVEAATSKKSSQTYDVNRRVAFAFTSLGLGHAGLSSFSEVMGLRPLSKSSFQEHKVEIEAASQISKRSVMTRTHRIVRDAYLSSNLATPDSDDVIDITVSYDGSWHKRGHTSNHGVGCVIDSVTGLVVDYEAMTSYCQVCTTTGAQKKKDGEDAYDVWWSSHQASCEANHQGSSGAMEVAAAKLMWQRSLTHKMRYTTMISDGDCKTHNELQKLSPYGEKAILKEECINHFAKRLGTALRKVVATEKSRGVTLGGARRGSLTQNKMAQMQRYFTSAILSNPGSLEDMKTSIWAIFYHSISTDDNPQHFNCPPGVNSWCAHQKAIAQCLPPPPHKSSTIMSEKVATYIKPTFERLTSNELLGRCLQGRTQNPNESVHSVIWNFIPKGRFVGAKRIKIGLYLGTGQFNCGSQSLHQLMIDSGLTVGAETVKLGALRDSVRIKQAEKALLQETKRRRDIRRQAHNRLQVALEAAEGGPSYASGAF